MTPADTAQRNPQDADRLDDLRTQLAIKQKMMARTMVEITTLTARISRAVRHNE